MGGIAACLADMVLVFAASLLPGYGSHCEAADAEFPQLKPSSCKPLWYWAAGQAASQYQSGLQAYEDEWQAIAPPNWLV